VKRIGCVGRLRASRRFLPFLPALPLLAVLTACGPGIGGTGTGSPEIDLSGFGAQALSVCSASFAARLACGPGTSAGAPVASPGPTPAPTPAPAVSAGTGTVVFADTATGREAVWVVEGNRATLSLRCAGQSFSGSWGIDARGNLRFFGTATGSTGVPVAAQLAVDATSGTALQLRLLAANGSALAPAVVVDRVASEPPAPERCP
jgi:hypothetical protein